MIIIITSISEVANGNLSKASAWVSNTFSKAVHLAIAFAARLIGLGGVAEKLCEIIGKVRKSKAIRFFKQTS